MNAKEKARELVDKMYGETPIMINITLVEYAQNTAKQCALICVEQMKQENYLYDRTDGYVQKRIDFLEEVQQEIKLL